MKNLNHVIVKMPCIVLCCAMMSLLFCVGRVQLQKIRDLSGLQGRQYENSLKLYMSRIYDSANSLDEDGTLPEILDPMNYTEIEKKIDTFHVVSENIIEDTAIIGNDGMIYVGSGRSRIREDGNYLVFLDYNREQVVCTEVSGNGEDEYGIFYIKPVFQNGQKKCVIIHQLKNSTFFNNIKENTTYPILGEIRTDGQSWDFIRQNMRIFYRIQYPVQLENCNFTIVIRNSVERVLRVTLWLGLLFAVILAAVWLAARFAADCTEKSVSVPLQKINQELNQYADDAEKNARG